jgi:aminoglycoside phosphotransferase (APT) family kinase protein
MTTKSRDRDIATALEKARARGRLRVVASPGARLGIPRGHKRLAELNKTKRPPLDDDRLPGLALVRHGALRSQVLAATLRVPELPVGGGAEVLNHPIEDRGLVRFRLGASRGPLPPSLIAHLYEESSRRAGTAFAAIENLHRNGFDGGACRVPRPIAHVPYWRMMLREDANGTALRDLPRAKQAEGAAAIGRLLARLHSAPLHLSATAAAARDAEDLETLVALAIEVMPYQLAAMAGAHVKVRRDMAALPAHKPALIHGDFQPRHLLIDGRNAVLLDGESMGHGDPARDIGAFQAHLRRLTHRGAKPWPELELAFLAGYGGLTPALEARAIVYLKAELLTLACRCALSPRERIMVRPLLRYIGDDVPVLAA